MSGGTGSGKTILLNVLAGFIPAEERIVVLEDTAELNIKKPHVISAEAQLDTRKTPISFADLLKAALCHRPDRIIVGEVRGTEARVLLDALNTGHRGSLTTIHANAAEEALHRLSHLAMRSSGNVHLHDVEAGCRRSIDVVVHIVREGGCELQRKFGARNRIPDSTFRRPPVAINAPAPTRLDSSHSTEDYPSSLRHC